MDSINQLESHQATHGTTSTGVNERVVVDDLGSSVYDSRNATNSGNLTDSDSSVESAIEKDVSTGAQEVRMGKPRPTTRAWKLYRKELDRIAASIERASSVTEEENESQKFTQASEDLKCINISFRDGIWYKLPRDACCTWKRMETFLHTWFAHDKACLLDLERGNYRLLAHNDEVILPQVWAQVLKEDVNIIFSRNPPSASSSRSPSPSIRSDISTPESPRIAALPVTQNRIRYSIKYMRRRQYQDAFDSESGCDTDNSFDEPVGFEVENSHDNLPALEEVQEIIAPSYAPPRRKWRKERNGDDSKQEKKIRLRTYDRLGNTRLKINSPFLLNIIRSVIVCSSEPLENENTGLTDGIFAHPYKDLYLNLEAIQGYQTPTNALRMRHSPMFNSKFDEHLELLLKYLKGPRGVPFEAAKSDWAKAKPITSFATLWLLLKPGSDVYARDADGNLSAYVIDQVTGGVKIEEGRKKSSPYLVTLWNLVFGGSTIRPRFMTVEINIFDNSREILSLPVFPMKFKDEVDGGTTRKKLIARGQKYFRYSKRPTFLQYSGIGLKLGKSYKRARVVVEHTSQPWEHDEDLAFSPHCPMDNDDFSTSLRIARCECPECQGPEIVEDLHAMPFSDYRNIDPRQPRDLTSHQYMLMSSHMFAFILKDRAYDLLDVDLLDVAEMAEAAIDKLVMDTGNKEIIKAIAKIYTHSDSDHISSNKKPADGDPAEPAKFQRFSADFISGKGEGQIILLHGPPGTGKTLTAESVAEYTKRPLLNITAADLGHEPAALEKSLLKYFRRATDWHAIVLLDEADVYLEQRSVDDLRRNSIVSVFLRAMDYFQGILFLTTNRVGHFDEAFRSRIHLSLGYKTLNNAARAQIWDNLFQKLTEDYLKGVGPKIEFGMSAKEYVKLERVMSLNWNGREIRNAFQTAVALAVYDANYKNGGVTPYLSETHLEQVTTMSTAFKNYMESTHEGMTDSERAAFYGLRSDSPTSRSRRGKNRFEG